MDNYIGTIVIIAIGLLGGVVSLLGVALTNINRELKEKVTLREYMEYKDQVKDRWLSQAEINRQALEAYMQSKSYQAWKDEFDLSRERQDRLDDEIRKRIDILERKRGE